LALLLRHRPSSRFAARAFQFQFAGGDGERLTFAAYEELGGLEGAIGRAAEQAFGSLDAAARAVCGPILPNGSRKNSGSSGGVRLFHVRGES